MRIVSLSPSLTEILGALGLQDLVVGCTNLCPQTGSSVPIVVGSPKAWDRDSILGLHPDAILVSTAESDDGQIRELRKSSEHVTSFEVRSPQAVCDTIAALGRLFHKIPEAQNFIQGIENELKRIRDERKGREPVRALILLWNQPLITVNFDTYISRLVESAGTYNVFHPERVREFPVEMEEIVKREPEIAFLASEPFGFKKRHITGFRKYRILSKIPIKLIDGRLFSRFGLRTVEALKLLSAHIGEHFEPTSVIPPNAS